MTAIDLAIVVVLSGWFVLTVIVQFGRETPLRRLRVADRLVLLPTWAVFAPRPVDADRIILYRDVHASGDRTPWCALAEPGRGPLPALWNPAKRVERATVDLCDSLSVNIHQVTPRQLLVHLPYLLVLGRVSREPAGPMVERRQFLVARVRPGTSTDADVFEHDLLSAYHRLPSQVADG
jgi:hypothetical protein